MMSQKKSSLKMCNVCLCELSSENWKSYNKNSSHYICNNCLSNNNKEKYSDFIRNKQYKSFLSKRSAVIYFYGNLCEMCLEEDYEKLLIDTTIKNNNIYNYLYNMRIIKDKARVLCYNCFYTNKIISDKYYLKNKENIINLYGNECCICKENNINCLNIYTKSSTLKGAKLYNYLIKLNEKIDAKVLCYNCAKIKF
jgi:hypothetical protein